MSRRLTMVQLEIISAQIAAVDADVLELMVYEAECALARTDGVNEVLTRAGVLVDARERLDVMRSVLDLRRKMED